MQASNLWCSAKYYTTHGYYNHARNLNVAFDVITQSLLT